MRGWGAGGEMSWVNAASLMLRQMWDRCVWGNQKLTNQKLSQQWLETILEGALLLEVGRLIALAGTRGRVQAGKVVSLSQSPVLINTSPVARCTSVCTHTFTWVVFCFFFFLSRAQLKILRRFITHHSFSMHSWDTHVHNHMHSHRETATHAHRHPPSKKKWYLGIPQPIIMTLQRVASGHYLHNGSLYLVTVCWCVCKQPLCVWVSVRFLRELPVRACSTP